MKPKFLTAIAITAMAIVSCSVDTDTIGSSLTNETDKLEFSTRSFQAFSRSVLSILFMRETMKHISER